MSGEDTRAAVLDGGTPKERAIRAVVATDAEGRAVLSASVDRNPAEESVGVSVRYNGTDYIGYLAPAEFVAFCRAGITMIQVLDGGTP